MPPANEKRPLFCGRFLRVLSYFYFSSFREIAGQLCPILSRSFFRNLWAKLLLIPLDSFFRRLRTGLAVQGFARTLFVRVLRLRYAPLRMTTIVGVHCLPTLSQTARKDGAPIFRAGMTKSRSFPFTPFRVRMTSFFGVRGLCLAGRCAERLALDMAAVAKL